ncbi:hypothetical protein N7507_007087 [Penicillium longicatenatum]|nr:hypothetical protein N7507_007087 [Penicillium longicatenatum]
MGILAVKIGHMTTGKIDIAVETIFLLVAFVAVGGRLWSRKLQRVGFQINDWAILVATILMTGRYVVEVIVVLWCGLGLHVEEVMKYGGPDVLVRFGKLAYADNLLWVTLCALVKLSILHFYISLFRNRGFIRVSCIVMGLCVAFRIGGFFSIAFFCIPVSKNWYSELSGKCGDSHALYVGCAATDLIIDIITILLPMPVLYNLQLPTRKKLGLMGIFALGFIIIAITCLRKHSSAFKSCPASGHHQRMSTNLASCTEEDFKITKFASSAHGSEGSSGERIWRRASFTHERKTIYGPDVPLVPPSQSTAHSVYRKSSGPSNINIQVTSDWEVHSMNDSTKDDELTVGSV